MTGWRAVAVGLLAAGLCGAAWASVSASVDRTRLAAGDSVQLTLQTDSASGDPDLAPLARDFDILGRSSSTSYQLVNGQASTTRQLILTLVPHHAGTVQVPPLRWGQRADAADPAQRRCGAGALVALAARARRGRAPPRPPRPRRRRPRMCS